MLQIDRDLGRFRDIVKGRVRKDLRRYMSSGELIGRQGKKLVSIPLPQIGIPRLRYGPNNQGIGQGEGDEGDGAGEGDKAGNAPGEHLLEVELTVDELAEILGEELELPKIEPKGQRDSASERAKYKGISLSGPESLRHFKRTFKRALQRTIAAGTFDPKRPVIVPIKEDRRYRTYVVEKEPRSAAVLIYMMDVSGSMGKEQKEIVRSEAFWIDTWIRYNYDDVETRFIIHDATAREVDRDTFFRTRESGGTLISSAYKLCMEIIDKDYPATEWNIYPFHFSDGDNWSQSDTRQCVEIVKSRMIPICNQFSYAQVDSQYGSGQFIKDLHEAFASDVAVTLSRIPSRDAIMDSIRELLGKGALTMAFSHHRFLREGRRLPAELEEARVRIRDIAKGYGLDFYETIFEMCTYEEINMLAAYGGFPVRYPHWRWGMEYLETQKGYEFGLSKIYEMVINTDPAYAYLMDNNLMVDQKLVMAHVYGHVDFFKNNQWFGPTDRRMLDEMANHAAKISRIIDRRGQSEVERFIDICLSIDNLIDPYAPHITRKRPHTEAEVDQAELDQDAVQKMPAKGYMDRFINPPEFLAQQRKAKEAELKKLKSFPEEPERDVVGFLLAHAPLERWQHEVLSILREEAYYFAPQGQTKIMNEGWATFWHTTIMTQHVLTDSEVIDYADHHAGTVHQAPGSLNPYKLGLELWRNIEDRWNKGRFGNEWLACEDPRDRAKWDTKAGLGREKMFEVRKTHNDITFLDAFLTEDFCREQGFFTTKYDPKSRQWIVDSREFADVKQQLLQSLVSRGTPRVYVVDANHHNRGELRMVHSHEGLDVQMEWAATVLGNLAGLWQRPVHLDTWLDGKPITLAHDGTDIKKTYRKEAE